jgi:hypothetical protein
VPQLLRSFVKSKQPIGQHARELVHGEPPEHEHCPP